MIVQLYVEVLYVYMRYVYMSIRERYRSGRGGRDRKRVEGNGASHPASDEPGKLAGPRGNALKTLVGDHCHDAVEL